MAVGKELSLVFGKPAFKNVEKLCNTYKKDKGNIGKKNVTLLIFKALVKILFYIKGKAYFHQ